MPSLLKLLQFRAAYNLPVHAAVEHGIFARHGLEVVPSYTLGSLYSSKALKTGDCDIAHTGADDIIADVETDPTSDLFIFAGLHNGLFALAGAPGCSSVEELRSKKIGVDAKTSGFVLVLERMLRTRGFSSADYELIAIGGWESRYRELIGGTISATLLTEPFLQQALDAGCNLLARDYEMIADYQGTCAAASRHWAHAHSELLVRYIRAYVEATQWCFNRENRPSCLDILARHTGISGSAGEHTLDTLLDPQHGLHSRAAVNLPGVIAAIELRAELGYLAPPLPRAEKYVDLSYYGRALAQG